MEIPLLPGISPIANQQFKKIIVFKSPACIGFPLIPKSAFNQWLGRKLEEREALARSFVAKLLYKHPTTRDLIKALQSAPNLRKITGFETVGDIPSESTFSRAFGEFAASGLGARVHDTLVKEYLAGELIGHISRDATAIIGR